MPCGVFALIIYTVSFAATTYAHTVSGQNAIIVAHHNRFVDVWDTRPISDYTMFL